jgi:cysteinylglycine-S-conjugate dipeptidase
MSVTGFRGAGDAVRGSLGLMAAESDAELVLMRVEEPQCLIHAPNERVHPDEIRNMALTEALFLQHYATAQA